MSGKYLLDTNILVALFNKDKSVLDKIKKGADVYWTKRDASPNSCTILFTATRYGERGTLRPTYYNLFLI